MPWRSWRPGWRGCAGAWALSRWTSSSAAVAYPRSPASDQVPGVQRGDGGGGREQSRPRSVGAGGTARGTWSLPFLPPAMGALLVFWGGSWDNRSPQVWGSLPGPHLPSTGLETGLRVASKFSVPSRTSSAAESVGRSVGAPRFPSACRPLPWPHPLDPFVSSLSPSSYCIPWTTIHLSLSSPLVHFGTFPELSFDILRSFGNGQTALWRGLSERARPPGTPNPHLSTGPWPSPTSRPISPAGPRCSEDGTLYGRA